MILDDFREAYYWLRHNTKPDAKILSWCVGGTAAAYLLLAVNISWSACITHFMFLLLSLQWHKVLLMTARTSMMLRCVTEHGGCSCELANYSVLLM